MKFHPRAISLKFAKGVKRPEKSNAIDMLCSGEVPPHSQFEKEDYERNFAEVPAPFTDDERKEWLGKLTGVAVSSDAFVSLPSFCLTLETANAVCDSSHSSTMSTEQLAVVSNTSLVRQAVITISLFSRQLRTWGLPLLSRVRGCFITRLDTIVD